MPVSVGIRFIFLAIPKNTKQCGLFRVLVCSRLCLLSVWKGYSEKKLTCRVKRIIPLSIGKIFYQYWLLLVLAFTVGSQTSYSGVSLNTHASQGKK